MICAVVLAAGRSRRMGTQKLLLDYGPKPLITHVVDQLLASNIDRVFVVGGHDPDRIARAVLGRDVSFLVNADYDTGMLSSMRCGVQALPDVCRAVLVTLGDQPAITPDIVNRLISAFHQTKKGIIVPLHNGRRGHPTLIATRYRHAILTQYDDVGLRGLLGEYSHDVFELSVAELDIAADIDTPEDYARQLRLRDGHINAGPAATRLHAGKPQMMRRAEQ